MLRSLNGVFALVWGALAFALFALPSWAGVPDRTLPMRFELRVQGPAESCGTVCQSWISASGSITAETPRDFKRFARGLDLNNTTMVLDSDGGSVLGAIALGREIRRLALTTAVGRIVDLRGAANGAVAGTARGVFSPHADCESMCAFVLLGGVHRIVPPEARVRVHQIWLGDRREDPTAANYSAEDLVLVQRDIGRLAQFTAEMGASIDLLDLALRIPPWEPMHSMTRDELRRTRLATEEAAPPAAGTLAVAPTPPSPRLPSMTQGARVNPISERRWAMAERDGVAVLARRHPLTVEGETIGWFDLVVSCGAGGKSYDVRYVEHRHSQSDMPLPAGLGAVTMRVASLTAKLTVASSERNGDAEELVSYAAGSVPASLMGAFASSGRHSMVIETKTAGAANRGMVTVIRLGNTGAQQSLPQLAAQCGKAGGARAELPLHRTGGYAAAQ